jgi:hypothetical protein
VWLAVVGDDALLLEGVLEGEAGLGDEVALELPAVFGDDVVLAALAGPLEDDGGAGVDLTAGGSKAKAPPLPSAPTATLTSPWPVASTVVPS